MESCATGGTDYRNKEQSGSATPDIPRKGHMGKVTIRDDWWPITQEQLERQTWQRTICQDKEQHMITTMARTGRVKRCLSASPSSSTPLENHQGTAMSTSAFANTIAALFTNSNHLDKRESLQLLLEAKTQGFQGTGISTIDKLPMDGRGPATHHHT
jgi:hypothetical protein